MLGLGIYTLNSEEPIWQEMNQYKNMQQSRRVSDQFSVAITAEEMRRDRLGSW